MKRTFPIRTAGEINKLLGALREWNRNYFMFALIGINWGLRCSDILSLTIGSVIAGSGKRIQIADRIIVVEKKTKHERRIEIVDAMKDALYEHIKLRAKKDGGLNLSAPLILSQKKDAEGKQKALSRYHASYVMRITARGIGIQGSVGTHGLRKTFAYQAWINNTSVDVIQKIFGHSSVDITHRYACIPMGHEVEVYKKVNFGTSTTIKRTRNRSGKSP